MRVLVTGATGYIGGRLVTRLLEAGYAVRCFAREPARLSGRFKGVEITEGDVFDRVSVRRALEGIDVAFYLVHSMNRSDRDFAQSDRVAAALFREAAGEAGVKRIVYLGGLGDGAKSLSAHLRSRQEVGDVLRAGGVAVTEFRAAMIVGSGSASFEMMRYLTDRLPVMIAPKWVRTRCQPIDVGDVLSYLSGELAAQRSGDAIFEIGGADVLTYAETMLRYARIRGLRRAIVVVPFFTPRLSSAWVHLVTPIPASLARPLIDGLRNEVIVRDPAALAAFPQIEPLGYDAAVRRALDRYASSGPETTWFDAYDVRTLPGEFAGTTQGMLVDRRQARANAPAAALFRTFTSLGGKRGWLFADALWELRGLLDLLAGGVGTRRGRRSATELRIGDAVDFWRVEAYEPDRLLRLRAEMRLPGSGWLQFEALPNPDGTSTLRQTAFFDPHGVLGYLYWFAVLPFHEFVFGNMSRRIAREAESSTKQSASSVPRADAAVLRGL
ncbi:MAG: SDR family oxidoreductase [Candidatus Baltobacteraceae bacterium]|jgi:uncharacterized protein YbjT (DUF2867 family)